MERRGDWSRHSSVPLLPSESQRFKKYARLVICIHRMSFDRTKYDGPTDFDGYVSCTPTSSFHPFALRLMLRQCFFLPHAQLPMFTSSIGSTLRISFLEVPFFWP
ncbi:hypothetical protein C8Q74DRAFT_869087 [Fomes fomentarius]|nr:hypothetical protein C8Q74DRAFT_869087 [Fomes fomentarius]